MVISLKVSGRVAYIGPELNLEKNMEGYVGTYNIVDDKGNSIPRVQGKLYKQQGALFYNPKQVNDGDDDDDGDNNFIDENAIKRARELGKKFAENFEKNAKTFDKKKNKASYAYEENDTEYKKLVDAIGKHSTYDAVATLYGGYFDEGTFSGIAEKVIPLYFHEGENVNLAIKELEHRHKNN